MISPNDFRNGMVIKMGGDLYSIVQFQHIKPGKGGAFVRTKLKNLRLDRVIDKTFREADKVEDIYIEQRKLQYLYGTGDVYHFMDNKDYEQVAIDRYHLKNCLNYLKEGEEITANFHDSDVIAVSLPVFVKLRVKHTEPGIRGDTARGGFKTAELETGLSIQVPLFVNTNDLLKIDTRTGKYVERA